MSQPGSTRGLARSIEAASPRAPFPRLPAG
jgi:hypothetical protein